MGSASKSVRLGGPPEGAAAGASSEMSTGRPGAVCPNANGAARASVKASVFVVMMHGFLTIERCRLHGAGDLAKTRTEILGAVRYGRI